MYIDKTVLQILFQLDPSHVQGIDAAWESYKSQIEDIYFASIVQYIKNPDIKKPNDPTLVRLSELNIAYENIEKLFDENTEEGQIFIAAAGFIASTDEFYIIFEAGIKDFNKRLIDKITPNLTEDAIDKLEKYIDEAEKNIEESKKIYSEVLTELTQRFENDDAESETDAIPDTKSISVDDLIQAVNPK